MVEGREAGGDDEWRTRGGDVGEGSDEFVMLVGGEGSGDAAADEPSAGGGVVESEGDGGVSCVDPEEVVVVGAGEGFVGELVEGW